MDINIQVLKILMAIFRIKQRDLRIGYSKVYICRILSGDLKPSQEFFIKLNNRLLELITQSGSASSVFQVSPVRIDGDLLPAVEKILKSA